MSQEAEVLAAGSRVGKYEIVRLLGAGGMGAVYEALHPELRKRVAIKTLLRALTSHPEARERFLREGQAAARLRHPHVVDIADVGTHEGLPFLVMEYLEGEPLDVFYRREAPVAPARLLDLVVPIIAAIGTGHEEGVIHRDIKPQNVFLSRGRHGDVVPKVLDFGISKLSAAGSMSLTSTSVFLGTVTYMSPEQAQGAKHVDGRSDEYALGLLLYEGLTGAPAYDGDNPLQVLQKVAQNQFALPRQVNPNVPPGLETVLLRALAHDVRYRFPTVFGLGFALLPYASDRTRYLWQDVFRRGEAEQSDAPVPPPARPFSGPTRVLDVVAAAPSRGAPGPVPGGPPPPSAAADPAGTASEAFSSAFDDQGRSPTPLSTFDAAAVERDIDDERPARHGRWGLAAGAVLVSGLIVAGAVALRGGARKEPASPSPAGVRPAAAPLGPAGVRPAAAPLGPAGVRPAAAPLGPAPAPPGAAARPGSALAPAPLEPTVRAAASRKPGAAASTKAPPAGSGPSGALPPKPAAKPVGTAGDPLPPPLERPAALKAKPRGPASPAAKPSPGDSLMPPPVRPVSPPAEPKTGANLSPILR